MVTVVVGLSPVGMVSEVQRRRVVAAGVLAALTLSNACSSFSCAVAVAEDHYLMWSQTERLVVRDHGVDETLVDMKGCGLGTVHVHPNQDRVSFSAACGDRRSGLYVVDLDGVDPARRVLSGDLYGAAWSPDGGWLATAKRNPRTKIYVLMLVRHDGRERQVVPTPVEVNNPSWGPAVHGK